MKIKLFVAALLATSFIGTAGAQETVINITGATAFRAASHNAIRAMLGGEGTTEYAFTGSQGLSGSNKAVFRGNLQGIAGTTVIRTSWSGSTEGIKNVAEGNNVNFLPLNTPTTTAGNNVPDASDPAVPKFAFSDVFQAASDTPTPVLDAAPVGVIPFMFVANEGAPANMTNITDQIHEAMYSQGSLPLSFFTGSAADRDVNVYPVGRNNGSGSRASILAETGYGVFQNVQQFTGTASNNAIQTLTFVGNGGYSSNSGIRDLLINTSNAVSVQGSAPQTVYVVSYLTISDALFAINPAQGAKELFYNGMQYSVDNVKNGKYSLWGYEVFLNAAGLTSSEQAFKDRLIATLPTTLGTAAIPIPDMNVTRFGGDGGLISP